jgi:hypothetical protein
MVGQSSAQQAQQPVQQAQASQPVLVQASQPVLVQASQPVRQSPRVRQQEPQSHHRNRMLW